MDNGTYINMDRVGIQWVRDGMSTDEVDTC